MSLKTATNTAANTHELLIEVDAAAFESALEKAFNKAKKNIQIPGFRKGKVTRRLAEKYFGENAFYEDAVNLLVGPEINAAVEEAKLELVDQPAVELLSVDKEKGVELKAVCTTKPEVTVPEYKGIKAPKAEAVVTDEDVEKQIQATLARNARIISIDDRAAELKDEVIMDFEGFLDGVAFEGGKGDNFALTLGSGQFIPGFEEQIVGHNVGEKFDINVTFPADYQMENLAGKETVFKINLKEIKSQELPTLDDDFVKDTSEFETVDELKADIKKKLIENAEAKANADFENEVYETLINTLEGEIPECMYERRIDRLVSEFEQRLSQQGMNIDLYLQYTGMDMDSFRASHLERATSEVKLRLALEKVAELEKIEIADEDLEKALTELAESNKMSVDAVKKFINVEDYRIDLMVGKAAEIVKDAAVVDNTIVSEASEAEVVETEAPSKDAE